MTSLRPVEQHGITVWAEPDPPTTCPNGHKLIAGQVTVSWLPCTCQPGATGHRTHRCDTCGVVHYRPGHRPGPGVLAG